MDDQTSHNARLCAWLLANDLDPSLIPIDAQISIDSHMFGPTTITTDVFVRHLKGGLVAVNNRALRQTVTVPLKVAWAGFDG
jgi:hypothetical protein